MRNTIHKSEAIRIILGILFLLVILAFYPFRLLTGKIAFSPKESGRVSVMRVNGSRDLRQRFHAQYEGLSEIEVEIPQVNAGKYLYAALLDENGETLLDRYLLIDSQGRRVSIPIGEKVEVGKVYTLLLKDCFSEYEVRTLPIDPSVPTDGLLQNGEVQEGRELAGAFVYSVPLSKKTTLLGMAILALLFLVLQAGVRRYYKRFPEKDALYSVKKVLRTVLYPLLAVFFCTLFLLNFPGKAFDDRWGDLLFYGIGILITALLSFYAVGHETFGTLQKKPTLKQVAGAILIALSLQFACEYVNGLYDINHSIAERKLMISLLLLSLLTCKADEICNRFQAIVIPFLSLGALLYCRQNWMIASQKEYELHNTATMLTAVCAVLIGILVVSFFKNLVYRHQLPKADSRLNLFGILCLLLSALLILFRNTRWWGIALVFAYGVYAGRLRDSERREEALPVLAGGLQLHFYASVLYCMLFRLFTGFVFARFSFTFHTVTITAQYLTMMEAAAACFLIDKIRRTEFLEPQTDLRRKRDGSFVSLSRWKRRWKSLWKEFVFFGCVGAYGIFTMSRTAYFSVAMVLLVLLLLSGRKRILLSVSIMVSSILVLFPAVFAMQRILPALVGRPYIFTIEQVDPQLRGRTNTDNRSYMCLERFHQVFCEKILGMSGGGYNFPEDRENYDSSGKPVYPQIFGKAQRTLYVANIQTEDLRFALGGAHVEPSFLQKEASASGKTRKATAFCQTPKPRMKRAGQKEEETGLDQYTNGRLSIYKTYLTHLNWKGHDRMGAEAPNGEILVHAHNTYLQVAYDHGILTGGVFLLWVIFGIVSSALYEKRFQEKMRVAGLPLALFLAFAFAGVSEWVFQFGSPMTVALMLGLPSLMWKREQ